MPAEGSLDRSYNPPLIRAALATGQATPATVTEHAFRIVRTLFAAGFFDRPPYVLDESRIDVAANEALAQRVGAAGRAAAAHHPGRSAVAAAGPVSSRK